MKREILTKGSMFFMIPLLALSLLMGGCADDGSDGAPGAPGGTLINADTSTPTTLAAIDPVVEITGVTIASPPVVSFTVTDSNTGLPISGIGEFKTADNRYMRFTMAKLVAGTNGNPDSWVSYTRDTTNDGTTPPDYDTGTLVDNGDGSYKFTFNTNVTAVTGVPFEPGLTHRIAGQMGNSSVALKAVNFAYDFVPSGAAVTNTREIAMTSSCNECHGELSIHGRRTELKYCVTCHNPDLAGGEGNMSYMVHFIHNATGAFTTLDGAWDVSGVLMPTGFDVRNCMKCHNGNDAATTEANNWQFLPNKAACEGCHTGSHPADQPDNSGCVGCHSTGGIAGSVEMSHRTNFSTENNPEVPAWAKIVKYDIASLTEDASGNPIVKFRVQYKQLSTDPWLNLDLNALPAGVTFGPTFRIAWALPFAGGADPIDGPAIAAPADFNNHGGDGRQYFTEAVGSGTYAFDQPTNISMSAARLLAVNAGAVMDADGYFTYTLDTTPFPATATRKAVAIESGFSFADDNPPDFSTSTRLPGEAVIAEIGTARRQIVDSAKCAGCHERLALHGGSRHVNPNQCVICHNQEITNSGSAPIAFGVDAEFSNNLKDMVHAIHAGAIRSTPYTFVRGSSAGGSGQGLHDFSHVTFFDREAECTVCHLDGTYLPENVPAAASWSTFAAAPADTVLNWDPADNLRYAPNYAACFACHDSAAAQSHFDANLATDRNGDVTETCVTCHASGRAADVQTVHGL